MNCAPVFNYGTAGGTWEYHGKGYEAMTVAPTRETRSSNW